MGVLKIGLEETVEDLRNKGEIGLRVPDTNVAMQFPEFFYLLAGNLHQLPEYAEAVQQNKVVDGLFEGYKKPHDILIPHTLRRELDIIKSSNKKTPHQQRLALKAQKCIEGLIRGLGGNEEDQSQNISFTRRNIRRGEMPICLENGAHVYFMDITESDISQYIDESWSSVNNDQAIIATALKFLEKNPIYKDGVFISEDAWARSEAELYGLKSEPFRLRRVNNLLQSNPGIYDISVNLTQAKKLWSKENPDINDASCGLNMEKSFLSHNDVIEVNAQDGRKKELEDPLRGYWIYDAFTEKLRHTLHYKRFLEEFTNRMYEVESQEGREDIVEYDPNMMDDLAYVEKITKTLYERGLIQEPEYRNAMHTLNKNSQKKGANQRKKIKTRMKEFESKGIIVPKGGEESCTTAYEGVLGMPFNNTLCPQGQQKPYLDHLLNPDIRVLSLNAPPGFGKTLWALAAGLYQVHMGQYEKVLYVSTLATMEGDIGYRKGSKAEKIEDKMRGARDDLIELFTDPAKSSRSHREKVEAFVYDLESKGHIDFDVTVEFKGQTKHRTFFILDESHFLTWPELAQMGNRPGRGSKFVVLGDQQQSYSAIRGNGYVSPENSGMSHMVEKLQHDPRYKHLNGSREQIYRGTIPEIFSKAIKSDLSF